MATGVSSEPARLSDPGFQASSEDAETPTQGHRLPIFQRLGAGVVENRARIEDDAPDATRSRQETSRRRRVRPEAPPRKSVWTLRVHSDFRFGKRPGPDPTGQVQPGLGEGTRSGDRLRAPRGRVPSLNCGVQCGAADLSKSAAAP